MTFDWETCLTLSPILWVAVLVGIAAGLRAGFRGLGLSEAVRMAVTGQVFAMVAGTALLAGLIALPEADRTSRTYFTHHDSADCTCLACNPDLLISQPTPSRWAKTHMTGHHLSPRYYIADAMRQGAEWGFFAPLLALIGAIPAASVAFIAYTFGARKRMERNWADEPLETPDCGASAPLSQGRFIDRPPARFVLKPDPESGAQAPPSRMKHATPKSRLRPDR